MSPYIRVVIVDDYAITRRGVRDLIESHPGLQVVAEGSAGEDVLRLVDEHMPDVLVTDLQMPARHEDPKGPRFEPVANLQRVMSQYPDTAVVILSQQDSIQTLQSMAEIGVRGYLLKSDDFSLTLPQAVEMIHRGASYFSPEVQAAIFSAPRIWKTSQLTGRQMDVVRAIAANPEATRAQLAKRLFISESTLKKHIGGLFEALQVSNMTSCLIKAMRMGIITLDREEKSQ